MNSVKSIFSCILLIAFVPALWAKANFFTLKAFEGSPRIINGSLATANETQHQVSLRLKLNDGYFFGTGHICGGSLIAPNVVLTAAHCFYDPWANDGSYRPAEDFIVVGGNLDRFDRSNTVVLDVEKIIYNISSFNLSTYEHDIALAILNGAVPSNHTTLKPININRSVMPANTICNVTGWGKTEKEDLTDKLMTLEVPIIDRGVCINDTDFDDGLIRDDMICAGYLEGERDACSGDSGGPLVCKKLLTGIISWGIHCAEPKLPGVYTNVSFYASWIDRSLKAENITLPGGGGGAASTLPNIALLFSLFSFILTLRKLT